MPGDLVLDRAQPRTILTLAVDSLFARSRPSRRLYQRLGANARRITATHRILAERVARGEPVPAEAEWLLDNYYVVDGVIRQVQEHLPRKFLRELPVMRKGPHAGWPRVYPLAATIIGGCESNVSEASLTAAVAEYQQSAALTIGELWALPIMMRVAVIEVLRGLADQMLAMMASQAEAKAALGPGRRRRLPDEPHDAFAVAIWDAIRESGPPDEDFETWVAKHLADPHAVCHREFCRQAANQVTIGNAVTALRLLDVLDWKEFFESTSLVEAALRTDPGGVYTRQDFATRDRCRRRIEQLARSCRRPELDVAKAAVAAAKRMGSQGHVTAFLLGDGRAAFAKFLGARTPLSKMPRAWLYRHPGAAYALLLIGFCLLFLALLAWIVSAPLLWLALAALPAALVASELSVGLTNFAVRHLVPPRVLPKLEYSKGVPTDDAAFVVIPALIRKSSQVESLIAKLEQHSLTNPDPALSFALLTDFADAPNETMPEDAAIIETLKAGIARLNAAHDDPQRFFAFHRRRLFNASENCWMGWERKRGKLDEFNRLLRGAADTNFTTMTCTPGAIPRVRFVLTLDADTMLPQDGARRMIATLAHPLNRPRISADGRRVEAGYAILQPRVGFLYRTGFQSWFARLFAGSAGVDPYSSAASDTSMDLFARANFTGKGLYDVDAFAATAGHAFPENRILSHDLIESNYARCALATDLELFDEFPAGYPAYARREHRWIRGDWQLLPWLGSRVPSPAGPLPNVLPNLERWKIIDNLRRSLVPPAIVLLLLLTWLALPGPTWVWTLFALSPILLPSVLLCFETLGTLRNFAALRSLPSRLRFNFANTLGQAALQVTFLVDQARQSLDAIGRALYRQWISGKHMLEWEPAELSQSRLAKAGHGALWSMGMVSGFAALIGVGVAWIAPERLWVAGPLLLAWVFSPAVSHFVSRPWIVRELPLSVEQEAVLKQVARKTWNFFATYVGETDHWLPPDNFQEDPLGMVAHRTSPTNIGLYLLAVLSARDFEFIGTDEVRQRLTAAFDTLDQLERHSGHWFNWYDTVTLKPLEPAYVSTVDSGNLLACLIALKHGLLEYAATEPGAKDDLHLISERAAHFADEMRFDFLYNAQRELFAIGYNAVTARLDPNHYDLLASEASIASFLAVARGEVPQKHWFRLGRLVTRTAGDLTLVSWGGTLFEYLMPRLLLNASPGVLLDRAQRTAVARQIEFGSEISLPWGVSESAFALLSSQKVYQYQSFGVPGLGLKRGLERDRVVAPYATLLAVDIDATAALKNLDELRAAGGEGPFGFYEALDYTPERCNGTAPIVVKAYMAHHQAMGFLAIANRLTGGIMRKRLATEPAVRAAQLLLDERVPHEAPTFDPDGLSAGAAAEVALPSYPMRRRLVTPHTAMPRTHLLSNGRYAVMLTNAGGGFSRCGDLDITRWRADATTDADGQCVFIRLRRKGEYWSAAFQPTSRVPESYEATFSIDKAEFRRVDDEIETLMEVVVVPDQDVEVRRITLTNKGSRPRVLDATSYVELVMSPHAADAAHPAFGKLFLETEWLEESQALLCRRRPRSPGQAPVFAVHVLATEGPAGDVSFETSREAFVGRRRTPAAPAALEQNVSDLGGSLGAVLDPVFAIRCSYTLLPGERAVLAFSTSVAASREDVVAIAQRYHTLTAVNRAFELAWAHARIELLGSHWKPDDVYLFQRLAGHLYYPIGPLRAEASDLIANRLGLPGLWSLGISGDLPIILLRMHSAAGLSLLRQLLQAHAFWQLKGLKVDFIVLLERAGGYLDELHEETLNQVRAAGLGDRLDRPDGVFLRKGWQLNDADRTLLLSAARVVLDDRNGPVATQADAANPPRAQPPRRAGPAVHTAAHFSSGREPSPLLFANEFGGFTSAGEEYFVRAGAAPPMPWSNVIANPAGGFLVTESGGGFAWAGNSQSNRLTPWSNDPVADPAGDVIYLFDDESGALWNPTPRPVATGGPVTVRHGFGYTVFEREAEGIRSELTVFVPVADPVKISLLKLKNNSARVRKLEAAYYVEWVLGSTREHSASHIVTGFDAGGALFARNPFNPDFAGPVSFADGDLRPRTATGDRMEFFGRNGSAALPQSFSRRWLSGRVGPRLDPCAAFRGSITLAPGEEHTLVFVLGQSADAEAARRMIRDYRSPAAAENALNEVTQRWQSLTRAVQVETPDAAFNTVMNGWLVYQTLSCRLWGRSAFYQSGGAYGFRDQLQDVCALVHSDPGAARAHLLRAATRQFLEGDVQHWWHEPAGNGVRTRCCDDLLWLPYAAAHYVETTGDLGVLQDVVPYLEAPILLPDQHEVYGVPAVAKRTGTLFEHCEQALEAASKLGAHELPLMGTGDWNDGMNAVGAAGRGESVWAAWFQIDVLTKFADLADRQREAAAAIRCRKRATALRAAVEAHAWDGAWYRRAWFDDGTLLGSATNDECRIDSIAQSWAVIAGGDPARAALAMDAVSDQLIKADTRQILLFTPPFDAGPLQPGYIKGYVPGVRENGGQYTHAAAWVVKALAMLGRGKAAHEAFELLNPAAALVGTYRGEPYAIAADVYSKPPHAGRAGWTWYTGSAAWLYRVGLEDLLGLRRTGSQLRFQPCVPAEWTRFTVRYRFGSTLYAIEFRNPQKLETGTTRVSSDGKYFNEFLDLIDDGRDHAVIVELVPASAEY